MRHASAAVDERRKTDDREAIAVAVARHAAETNGVLIDPAESLRLAMAAWQEFSDLEQTRAGVYLMSVIGQAHSSLADQVHSLEWADRYLPIAERLDDLGLTTRGIQRRGLGLMFTGRPREGITLLRGAHQLAIVNDLADIERGCRVLLTFYEQWGEPAAGLALGREGIEIGRKRGSRAYQYAMIGNAAWCAMRVGEWDWAMTVLDEWLEAELVETFQFEFLIDRAFIRALRGVDVAAEVEAAANIISKVTDPQYGSYVEHAYALASLAAGDYPAAIEHAEEAATLTRYFSPLALPVGARAALWAGDAATAQRLLDREVATAYTGATLQVDRARIAAGIAALEGRGAEALTGFLDAIRAYEGMSLPFEAAAAAVDMAVVLPDAVGGSPAAAAAIASGRETLTRLGAKPFLDRLDAALAVRGQGAMAARGAVGELVPAKRN
jgi:tetratricopeptide (TPR) repeat protein